MDGWLEVYLIWVVERGEARATLAMLCAVKKALGLPATGEGGRRKLACVRCFRIGLFLVMRERSKSAIGFRTSAQRRRSYALGNHDCRVPMLFCLFEPGGRDDGGRNGGRVCVGVLSAEVLVGFTTSMMNPSHTTTPCLRRERPGRLVGTSVQVGPISCGLMGMSTLIGWKDPLSRAKGLHVRVPHIALTFLVSQRFLGEALSFPLLFFLQIVIGIQP